MNYIQLINRFWRAAENIIFTPTQIACYFYILHRFNAASSGSIWVKEITVTSKEIEDILNVNRNTVREILNQLDIFTDLKIERKNGSKKIIITCKADTLNVQVDRFEKKPAQQPAQRPATQNEQVSSREDNININNININNFKLKLKQKNNIEEKNQKTKITPQDLRNLALKTLQNYN